MFDVPPLPRLESQGCHLIPLYTIYSLVLLPSPITLSVLSSFSACWSIFLNIFQKFLPIFFVRRGFFVWLLFGS